MSYMPLAVTIIITLCIISSINASPYEYNYYPNAKQYTRNITLKQGVLQGVVLEPKMNRALPLVEVYRGIPYAAPPVGELRFMPTGGAPSWFGTGVKYADTFGPVCPQKFPDEKTMPQYRKEYFLRLKKYLENQSEDCLYLNIYAPYQDPEKSPRTYPVMVYIHGESFEWNSGNPYDGSVLAAYGNVIVVTLNFRLGILGFLKAGTEELSKSNFGLVDQIAALLWVKDNIAAFGGDPKAVTLFGHGTGAVCASLLTISPMVLQDNERLFHRAILMGGTALADWALAGNPSEVTYQVSQALNCQIQDDFAGCLRRKRLDEIMAAGAITPTYKTRFGPVVDSLVVPNDPKKSMTQYNDIFKRFELMYGVTELESIHLLGPVALTVGMLKEERDSELRKYLRTRCEVKPEYCLVRTLAEYTGNEFTVNDQESGSYMGHEPDSAQLARDSLLDILSDARSVAPIVQMAKYHAALHLQSYFYVFTHKTHSREYIRNKSFNGEELPYVFGIPLDGSKFHFVDSYTERERLFSEIIMTYFCNFAYTGNPNMPRKSEFYTLGPAYWSQFDVDWPEYDLTDERYLQLDIPPQPSKHYRKKEITYWNELFPKITENRSVNFYPPLSTKGPTIHYFKPKSPTYKRPPIFITDYYSTKSTPVKTIYGKPYIPQTPTQTTTIIAPKEVKQGPTANTAATNTNLMVIIGGLFMITNLIMLLILYLKCYRRKTNNLPKLEELEEITEEKKSQNDEEAFLVNGCNIVRIMSKSSKSDDTYAAVKPSSTPKSKLSRQMSNSTIDAHTKVRDWITQEIVYKYSPRFLRRPKHSQHPKPKNPAQEEFSSQNETEKYSTLGRSPTRPVSPSDEPIYHQQPMKTSTITRPKTAKPAKVSVAVDATPSGRGNSVLMQQPIEMTKSLDYPTLKPDIDVPLRRSITLEDFSPRVVDNKKELRKSTTSINLQYSEAQPTIIKIEHGHSKSDPVPDVNYKKMKKFKTFGPNSDINVTSRDDKEELPMPLSPEESLMTIKRRKFPKVLPDHPGREALMHKRRSMPAHSLFLPIPESSSFSQPNSPTNKSCTKLPPTPPPRTTTLPKQSSTPLAVCTSEPMLAEDRFSPEPEVVCNNFYVGPLIPKNMNGSKGEELNTQPIYESLRNLKQSENKLAKPRTIVTANPNTPIKRADPRIVVRPTITRKLSDDKQHKNIPRVVVPDNQPQLYHNVKPELTTKPKLEEDSKNGSVEVKADPASTTDSLKVPNLKSAKATTTKSQIPMLVKTSGSSLNKESSSSESTPSEESDTGTVVKRV